MKNKYTANCVMCYQSAPAGTGTLKKRHGRWAVVCGECIPTGDSTSYVVQFSSGESYTRNRRGRCEDAPCCGCCTI